MGKKEFLSPIVQRFTLLFLQPGGTSMNSPCWRWVEGLGNGSSSPEDSAVLNAQQRGRGWASDGPP